MRHKSNNNKIQTKRKKILHSHSFHKSCHIQTLHYIILFQCGHVSPPSTYLSKQDFEKNVLHQLIFRCLLLIIKPNFFHGKSRDYDRCVCLDYRQKTIHLLGDLIQLILVSTVIVNCQYLCQNLDKNVYHRHYAGVDLS